MITEQTAGHFKIASVSERSAWGWGSTQMITEQTAGHFKIASVSERSAWGWVPTRTKQ